MFAARFVPTLDPALPDVYFYLLKPMAIMDPPLWKRTAPVPGPVRTAPYRIVSMDHPVLLPDLQAVSKPWTEDVEAHDVSAASHHWLMDLTR